MNINDYFYNYFTVCNYESKTNDEKLKIYNKAMFDYLNSNLLAKKDTFEDLFADYYMILYDKNKFFASIFLLNFNIIAGLINRNIYVDYDDELADNEYKIDYLPNEDCFEVIINSDANIFEISINSFFDIEEIYNDLKKQIDVTNCIKRLN